MSRWVLVDDTDSGIQYSGSWFQDQGSQNGLGNFGPPYEGTLHGINADGSFSYQFQGTKVLITGSVQFPAASASSSNPSWECSVDGTVIQTNTYAIQENRLDLCETDTLSDGTHTITVKVTSTDQHTFWFDYVQYFPSADANLDNVALSVDNTDSAIHYGPGWTSHYPGQITQQTGSALSFSFTGVSVTWVGFYDNSLPLSPTTATYAIDGGKPVAFNLNGAAAQASGQQYNQVFFTTPQIAPGSHTLQVVYQGNAQTAPLALAIFEVQGGAGSGGGSGGNTGVTGTGTTSSGNSHSTGTATSATPTSSGASSSPASTGTTQTGTSTLSPTSTASSGLPTTTSGTPQSDSSNSNTNTGSSKSSNTGAIIGGALGGLALLVALLMAFLYWRLRRKRTKVREYVVVDPFHPAPNPHASRDNLNMAQTAVGGRGPTGPPYNYPNNANSSGNVIYSTSSPTRPAEPGSPSASSTTNPYSGYLSASEASNNGPTTAAAAQSQFYTSPPPPLQGQSKAAEAARNRGRYVVTNSHSPASPEFGSYPPPAQRPMGARDVHAAPQNQMAGKALEAQGPVNRYDVPSIVNNSDLSSLSSPPGSPGSAPAPTPYAARVVRDEDSGLRFRPGFESGQMVEVLPPTYTPS